MAALARRLAEEEDAAPAGSRVCRGTLLSRAQFLIDVGRWGYADARLAPGGSMTRADVEAWTRAIEQDEAAGGAIESAAPGGIGRTAGGR